MVRAKFKLIRTESQMFQMQEQGWVEMKTLHFSPVYSSDPNSENRKFWQASPNGQLTLGVVNPEASSQFELNKEYYLDFSPAE
jgi:hypothetical protein